MPFASMLLFNCLYLWAKTWRLCWALLNWIENIVEYVNPCWDKYIFFIKFANVVSVDDSRVELEIKTKTKHKNRRIHLQVCSQLLLTFISSFAWHYLPIYHNKEPWRIYLCLSNICDTIITVSLLHIYHM
jgi:hypothetical protein